MTVSRDSVIWTVGIIGSLAAGLATMGDLSAYGIPEALIPYIRLTALVTGIVSGKMATSPLPGKSAQADPLGPRQ